MIDPLVIALVFMSAWALIISVFYLKRESARKVTPPDPEKKKDPTFELNEKFLTLENELRTLERRINDVDETSEARYRKISIRAKRAEQKFDAEEQLNNFTAKIDPAETGRSQLSMFNPGNGRRLIKR